MGESVSGVSIQTDDIFTNGRHLRGQLIYCARAYDGVKKLRIEIKDGTKHIGLMLSHQ